jgi:transcription termination factor Rho
MAQEETPVLPGSIDVLEQAADVAARPARAARGERTSTRSTKETKTTKARAAKAAAAVPSATTSTVAEGVAAQEPLSQGTDSPENVNGTIGNSKSEAIAGENTTREVVKARASENETTPEATPVNRAKDGGLPLETVESNSIPSSWNSDGNSENAEIVSQTADVSVQPTSVAEISEAATATALGGNTPEVPVVAPPAKTSYPAPVNAMEGLPREERSLESRGVRFRGREGRVEMRGRHGMPASGDPRAFRREERDAREMREPGRDPGRDQGRDSEGNGLPGGRLASPMRDSRGDHRGDHRGNQRNDQRNDPRNDQRNEQRGENRDNQGNQGRGRFERDLPRGRQELDLSTLEDKNLTELREIAKNLNIAGSTTMKKSDLVFKILEQQAENHGHQFKKGILDILPDGKGFLRTDGYLAGNEDVYVSQSQIKRFNLKTGDMVTGMVRPPKEMERHFGLLRVEAINGEAPDFSKVRKEFEKLTPIFPNKKFTLETGQENVTARIIDLVTPIGKGQRGLIVAPPKAGKTSLIKSIANSIAGNHPEVVLIVLLIDERPEEVTDIARSVKGEVVASTFDELPENHMRVAEMVFEKAKRLAEQKKDVVVLMDSLTRLARASNLVVNPSGRTMSGGLDPAAMHRPKRMFGAARNIEEGGSLTILATVLVDTGSRMDEYIFEELKGTGNMDLVLDRSLFDARIFPAIDINKSGTRRDDLLLSKEDMNATLHLRRTLAALDNDKAINLLIDRLKNTKTNEEFMQIVQRSSRAQAGQ